MGKIKNILLTGANGFLGSHILHSLINEGYSPILLLRANSDTWRIKNDIGKYKTFVLNNVEAEISSLFDTHEIDAIIHTATEYGRNKPLSEIIKTNVLFPVKLIEHGLKKDLKFFLNSDTFFAKPQFNQSYLNNYTESKRILQKLLINMASEISIANMRIEHVFGENDSDNKFVTSILKDLIHNTSEVKLTEGSQKRDFIYVKDVASAFIAVVNNFNVLGGYHEFEVGTGISISIRRFVEKVAQSLNSNTELNFGSLPSRAGEIEDSYANNSELEKIGWHPTHTVDAAIDQMIKKEQQRFTL